MFLRTSTVALLAVTLAACASQGLPGGPGGGPPGGAMLGDGKIARPVALLFTGMDANRDLLVSMEEMTAALRPEFARADADDSGEISGFEIADWCTKVLGDPEALPDRRAMDVDIGGAVSWNEFETSIRKEFLLADKDADGRLTRAELLMDAPRPAMGGPPGGRENRGPGRGGPPGGGPGGGRPPGGGGPGGGMSG